MRFLVQTFFILFLALPQYSYAQNNGNLKFKSLTLDDGLSQSNINCILQDKTGFIWFGTRGGLNRYNGTHFKVFLNNPSDSTTLSNNIIYCLYEDFNGLIWIGTQEGISIFNPITSEFTVLNINSSKRIQGENIVKSITQDRDSIYWIGTHGGGLTKLALKKDSDPFMPTVDIIGTVKKDTANSESLSSNFITSLITDKLGYIWIGTWDKGLNKLDPASDRVIRYDQHQRNGISSNSINALFEDRSGDIWVGTNNGLNRLRKRNNLTTFIKNENVIKYFHNERINSSLSNDVVISISQGKSGLIYIGTDGGGLNKYSKRTGVFSHYKNDVTNPLSIISNNVQCIFDDKVGTLWLGTNAGISQMESQRKKFNLYQRDGNSNNTISSNYVQALYKELNGTTWIGTVDGGLNRINTKTGKVTQYKNTGIYDSGQKRDDSKDVRKKRRKKNSKKVIPRLNLSDMRVMALHRDTRSTLWVGTGGGGLNKLDLRTERFKHYKAYPENPDSLSHNTIRVIYEDRQGILWIGTEGGGLNKFNRIKFKSYLKTSDDPTSLSNNDVRAIVQDKNGFIWIGTYGGGINKFNPKTEEFLPIRKNDEHLALSSNIIFCLNVDKNNILWIGTSEGLGKYNQETEEFKSYSRVNGLPNDMIYGILDDNNGNLWLSTNHGLSRFNIEKEEFNNYDNKDGLQSNEFIPGAFSRSKNGEMLFGGINGFNTFFPASVRDNDYIPNVVITEFRIFNKPVTINTPNSPLTKDISETTYIELSYKDVVFSFDFIALNFNNAEKNQYAYKLENFDPDWNYVGNRNFANYTNLAPGEYIFKVKASNNDGIWNEEGKSIRIKIYPPLWETWWFKSLSFLSFLFLGFLLYKLRVKRIEKKKEMLEKEVAERTAEVVRQRDELVRKSITLEKQKQEIQEQNHLLGEKTEEIMAQRNNIEEKNNQLEKAWDEVLKANNELKQSNSNLEEKVQERTAKLQEAVKKLVRSNQELDTFLYRASHDLKGPITRLLGLTQLAKLDNKKSTEIDYINIIEMSSIDMNKTLNKLINIHSINTKPVTNETIDFKAIFDEVVRTFELKIKEQKIKIEHNISQDSDIYNDTSLIKIIIENLLENAIIFKATARPKIVFSVACDKEKIVMKVDDNGMGIEKDFRNKIFDMFFRGSEISQGNGLGLYLVKKAVEKLNGKIIVESEEGKYTSFSLSFPRKKIDEPVLV